MSTWLGRLTAATARTTPVNDSAVPNTTPSATPLRSSRFSPTPSAMSSNSTPVKTTASRNSGIRSPLAAPTRWVMSFSALTTSSVAPEMKTNTQVMSGAPRVDRVGGGGGGRSPAAPGCGVPPRGQHRVPWPRPLVRGGHGRGHDPVVGREVADRIRASGIAGQLEGLAAAAAEVEVPALAAAAGLGHPIRPAEALEQLGPFPDPLQRVLPHAGPGQGQGVCGRAREDVAVGHHGELAPAPAAHAGLGVPAVVVRQDVDDLHAPLQTLLRHPPH